MSFALKGDEVRVTPEAADYFSALMQDDPGCVGVRLSIVRGHGCGGAEYDLSLVAGPQDGDEALPVREGLVIFVPGCDVLRLFGAVVDYKTDAMGNARVVIENPNEKGRCGCGESVVF